MMNQMKTYNEMILLPTLHDRYNYLKLNGTVAKETFGFERYLNQVLYRDKAWKEVRNYIITRDNGCELACEDYPISGKILIHHLNPITHDQILSRDVAIFDPNNLVCVSHRMHNAIHYGSEEMLPHDPIVRTKNDMCPWKNGGR